MKYLLAILFFVCTNANAQDTIGLRKATALLNASLLAKDTATLQQLLSANISYGHSNGWLQSNQDIMTDFRTGKIEYKKIQAGEESFMVTKQAVAVRSITSVEGVVNGNAFKMDLQVLQMWKRIKKQWVLIARQSVKVS